MIRCIFCVGGAYCGLCFSEYDTLDEIFYSTSKLIFAFSIFLQHLKMRILLIVAAIIFLFGYSVLFGCVVIRITILLEKRSSNVLNESIYLEGFSCKESNIQPQLVNKKY